MTEAAFNYPGAVDIAIIFLFIASMVGIGVYMSRAGQKSTKDYFTSGGKTPWWLLGTSMVATTFAADTPLTLAGWVVTSGVSQNWFWWCQVPLTMGGVFLFARLWKRANILTDQELVYVRYSGKPANYLRGFKALFLGLIYGVIVMGWVHHAMTVIVTLCFPNIPRVPVVDGVMKFLYLHTPLSAGMDPQMRALLKTGEINVWELIDKFELTGERIMRLRQAWDQELDPEVIAETLNIVDRLKDIDIPAGIDLHPLYFLSHIADVTSGINEYKILFGLFLITIMYTAISGLWGVLITDFIQFWIAMAGTIALAIIAVNYVTDGGGLSTLMAQLGETYGGERALAMVSVLPSREAGGMDLMPWHFLIIFIFMAWWSVGFTDGGSYFAQRMLSAKNEKHAAMGYLWYGVAHYALRMWPWIVVGFVAAVMFPHLQDPVTGYIPTGADAEMGYVRVMLTVLPVGLLGLVLASFMAAYMSTISTQVNLSASYVVNDFYRPFIKKDASERHYVRVSILATIFVAFLGIIVALYFDTISEGWFLLATMNGGIGVIYILRWYWHRVNAWTEATALFTLLIMAVLFRTAGHMNLFEGTWLAGGSMVPPYPLSLIFTVPISFGLAVIVTKFTKPVDKEQLKKFCRRVQPGGPGWKKIEDEIRQEEPSFVSKSPLVWKNFKAWILATLTIYLFLFGVSWLLIGDILYAETMIPRRILGMIFVLGSFVSGYFVVQNFSKKNWQE